MKFKSALIHIVTSIFLISFTCACSNECPTRFEFNYTINPLREIGYGFSRGATWANFTVHISHMSHVLLITKKEYDKMRDMEPFTPLWSRYNVTMAEMTTNDINMTIPFDRAIFVAIFNPDPGRAVQAHWILYQYVPPPDYTVLWMSLGVIFGVPVVAGVILCICWCLYGLGLECHNAYHQAVNRNDLLRPVESMDGFHDVDLKEPAKDESKEVNVGTNRSFWSAFDAAFSDQGSNHATRKEKHQKASLQSTSSNDFHGGGFDDSGGM